MSLPDPSSITSSPDLFVSNAYSLPQIRQIHKSLHAAIDDRSSRLRTQVGAGYRELLGTAETIVRMHGDADRAIDVLSAVGSRCSRGKVGAKAGSLARLRKGLGGTEGGGEEGGKSGVAARVKLLEACGLAAQIHLRTPRIPGSSGSRQQRHKTKGPPAENLVGAAKILVLGRLLANSFHAPGVKLSTETKAAAEAASKKLASQRRRLFRAVEAVLSSSDENLSRADILKALCAYSLATSGGAKDVVRHFLHVRGEAMALCFDPSERERDRCTAEDVERCLRLFTRTMVDVQKLVPAKLREALIRLAQTAIMQDPGMRMVEGLRLDVYERWCDEEIRYFTPYIQYGDLTGERAREMLTAWSEKGGQVVLAGLAKTLERIPEFRAIAQLRTTVLQLWIREGGKARGFDPNVMLASLREVVNKHLLAVLEGKVSKLRLVGSEMSATLESWTEGTTDQTESLWETDTLDMDMARHVGGGGGAAAALIQEVVARELGRNAAVSKALMCYSSWAQVIDEVGDVVSRLKKQRWESDFDDEIEDEDTIKTRERQLNVVDPKMMEDKLSELLVSAFEELEDTVEELWEAKKESPNAGHVAMYFLRVLRDVRAHLPPQLLLLEEEGEKKQKEKGVKGFGADMVPSLHDKLVETVMIRPLDEIVTEGLSKRNVVGRALWEGKPPPQELPTWPSPWAFLFLRNLSHEMEGAGIDLWSARSLRLLKDTVRAQLAGVWREALGQVVKERELEDMRKTAEAETEEQKKSNDANKDEGKKDEEGDNDKDSEKDEDGEDEQEYKNYAEVQRRELLSQWVFDIATMRCCLGPPSGSAKDELEALERAVFEETGLEGTDARQRIVKESQQYWNKTRLLFGLIEGPCRS
ncbi:hypothetical protein MKZ38_006538 [Zalerion maritima]|uniref:Conserved oligomeric Golgi complex subunit 1 n=1 Tax=Zalerion maritima TaxID=339359 RepID=A0AAD5S0T9_9PEZI|nr:hypothetical protein MKZ38_006538 [Zalerion maritima]